MIKNLPTKSLATGVYERIKADIFDFCLLPGDRFTETEVAARLGVSRTPVREALYRLEREGYIDVSARNGWSVKPFDFTLFENLYDVRVVLEVATVRKLCEMEAQTELGGLAKIWLVSTPALIWTAWRMATGNAVAMPGSVRPIHRAAWRRPRRWWLRFAAIRL